MLTGESRHQLDERGRVAVPKGFREALDPLGFLTHGWHGCLFLFPWTEWTTLSKALSEIPLNDLEGQKAAVFFLSGERVAADAQGRVVLPAPLREWAGVEREIVLVGAGKRAEIWAKDRWEVFQREQFSPERITAAAANLSIWGTAREEQKVGAA